MNRPRFYFFSTLVLVALPLSAVAQTLTVAENDIRIETEEIARVLFPVNNAHTESVAANLLLTFLDTYGKPVFSVEQTSILSPGTSRLTIPVPAFLKLEDAARPHFGWLRLKYDVRAPALLGPPMTAQGVISVSRITGEPFVLKLITRRAATTNGRYRVEVVAQNPTTWAPVRNVSITAQLTLEGENEDLVLKETGRTNTEGYAAIDFAVPKLLADTDAHLEVRATQGNFVRTEIENIFLTNQVQILVHTDKPIYQPGQTMRIRALVFDRRRKAVEGSAIDFTINDPDDNVLFQGHAKTSRFGEAHTEWPIPGNALFGPYQIEVSIPQRGDIARSTVAISRYELPTFAVTTQSDRSYYVANQNAQLTVKANYLFGKPVPHARVKVARESEREWNYREQKWEIEEGKMIEGTTDESGVFLATLDLQPDHQELISKNYREYVDLDYAAYVTDPTTGRTEQRRFAIRITQRPIHLYVVGDPTHSDNLPLEFYVAASIADGTPAVCDILIYSASKDDPRYGFDPIGRQPLARVKTNRYGVAKVTGLVAIATGEYGWDRGVSLHLLANDGSGNAGENVYWAHAGYPAIRLRTDRTLYRAFDPIKVAIESSSTTGIVVLNVLHQHEVLYTKALQLAGGKATVTIPGSTAFQEDITLLAYSTENSEFYPTSVTRRVSFPGRSGLHIDTKVPKISYAPGDNAAVRFRVHNGNGTGIASLLGITVLDKAVEERARTDAEFGNYPRLCCGDILLDYASGLPGLSHADINRLDRSRRISADIELAAEVVFAAERHYLDWPRFAGDHPSWPIRETLDYSKQMAWSQAISDLRLAQDYPTDETSLHALFMRVDPAFETLRDPWGNPYHLTASVLGDRNWITLTSAGPDERFHSPDDFEAGRVSWSFFRPRGELIQQALRDYHDQTGQYIRDLETLQMQLASVGQDFTTWRDPNGEPFTAVFGVAGKRHTVTIQRGKFPIWTAAIDYIAELWPLLDAALTRYYAAHGVFPSTDMEVANVLRFTPVPAERLMDPWGHLYYTTFGTESQYRDSIEFLTSTTDARRLIPVTQQSRVLTFRSAGPDGVEGTFDDFDITRFSSVRTEQSVEQAVPQIVEGPLLRGASGAIRGTVTDTTGALIPGVLAKVTSSSALERETVTNDEGVYIFRDLPPGVYQLHISLPGFQTKTLSGVPVRSGAVTGVMTTLEVASLATRVEVSAESAGTGLLLSSSASVGEVRQESIGIGGSSISTPRLREYFPETLLWQPALETQSDGNATVRFKLADSITTWKVLAIASTVDGQIALAEAEILSSKPFFVEHDPPRILTAGDEIALPIVVRNYLDRPQAVHLTMKPEAWFTNLDSSSRTLKIGPADAVKETFRFQAVTTARNGKQRITAVGTASDAIEKTVVVHPHGQQITQTSNRVFRGSSILDISISADALPSASSAELKVYPNLMSHIVDSIEAIMQRPHGCAEQTISSAYPSLLLLRYNKQNGIKADAVARKAVRYVQLAYDMLRGYQADDGGTSYWSRGKPDPAVTAHAVQFLTDAKDFIRVDEDLLESNVKWLVQQKFTGDNRQGLTLTGLIARVLSQPDVNANAKTALPAALTFLKAETETFGEPYAVASLALASQNAGQVELTTWALDRLERSAHLEGDTAYWDLQVNTPFYSWGLPGRIETTALVVRALATGRGKYASLVDRGLLFLLKNKDRYGVWYSTQATVNVLEALLSLDSGNKRPGGALEIVVNGHRVGTVSMTSASKGLAPLTVDLSRYIVNGPNHVELRGREQSADAMVQIVTIHYLPWKTSDQNSAIGALRLKVNFDKTEARIGDEITSRVDVERVGFRGYGMLLAEIGLPPGADVDRKSLEDAVQKAGWSLQRYDILPDRVVAYLWPEAGGTHFEFRFRPRYGLVARTAPSTIYDYYNPEETATVQPTLFTIR